jgi:hypothetical protein
MRTVALRIIPCLLRSIWVYLFLSESVFSFKQDNVHLASFNRIKTYAFQDDTTPTKPYIANGVSKREYMLSSRGVLNYPGLCIAVGPSMFGKGLFVYIENDCTKSSLRSSVPNTNSHSAVYFPRGAILCDYLGEFDPTECLPSDKAVGYGFYEEHDVHSWVHYSGRLMHLWEAVVDAAGQFSRNLNNARDLLEGHLLYFDDDGIQITKCPDYAKTRFVPFEQEMPTNYASYANDMAFDIKHTNSESLYRQNYDKNCFMLVWKLQLIFKNSKPTLVPLNPVLVSKKSIIFDSVDPIEVGLGYGWDYWNARIPRLISSS